LVAGTNSLVQRKLQNVELLADVNNLKLNQTKSGEIVPPRGRCALTVSPSAFAGFEQVDQGSWRDHQPALFHR
jgi:hypothetical protein